MGWANSSIALPNAVVGKRERFSRRGLDGFDHFVKDLRGIGRRLGRPVHLAAGAWRHMFLNQPRRATAGDSSMALATPVSDKAGA